VSQPAVAVTDLHYSYPDGVAALRGVSLTVNPGEAVGLLGPNGAGKSTLLLHLNGILGSNGSVSVDGAPLSPANLPAIRQRVGLVFQDGDDQLFMPTVFDDVAFGPRNLGHDSATVEARVRAALATVGMAGMENRPPHHLSVGQKKRVALATVLVMDCTVLVLDEPTAGLDPRGRREIIELLKGLPQTKIVATHDMALAWELCQRVVILDGGRVAADGASAELLTDRALLERHGLEMPALAQPSDAAVQRGLQ
jgi:cobalt transport protein ATP-binding subunit